MGSPEPCPGVPARGVSDLGCAARIRRPAWLGHAWRLVAVAGICAAVLIPHYATPVDAANLAWHEVHRHMLYLPILLAAIWYGWRGGLVMAVLICFTFFPHLLPHWAQQRHEDMGMLMAPQAGGPHAGHAGHMGHAMAMPDAAAMPDGAGGANDALADESVNLAYALAVLTYLLAGGGTGYLIEKLRAEQRRLREANARLTTRTREVFEVEEQLRRADRLAALGHLTAGLAHEIRNPLASIKGAAEIVGDPSTQPAARTEFSGIIAEEAERLDHVLGEFLDYARAQKAEGESSRAEVGRVLERVLALLRKPLNQAGITMQAELPAELPPVRIAENLLQQALLNLLLNAVQAQPTGGFVRVTAGEVAVGESAVPGAGEAGTPGERAVQLRIEDGGPGIAPEARPRVFDPFYTTKPQGTGLGLAIVHKIVSACGGRIELAQGAAGGAVFVLTLPASE